VLIGPHRPPEFLLRCVVGFIGEHALFGYIVSSSLNNQDVELYFAFNKKSEMKAKSTKPFYITVPKHEANITVSCLMLII